MDPTTLQPEAVPEDLTDQVCNAVHSSGTYNCGDGYVCLNGDYEAFYVSLATGNVVTRLEKHAVVTLNKAA